MSRHDTPRQTSQLVVALQKAIHGKLLALVVGAENSKSIFGDFSKLKVDCRPFRKLKVDFRSDFASFSNSKSTFDEAFALLSPEQICRYSDRISVQKSILMRETQSRLSGIFKNQSRLSVRFQTFFKLKSNVENSEKFKSTVEKSNLPEVDYQRYKLPENGHFSTNWPIFYLRGNFSGR